MENNHELMEYTDYLEKLVDRRPLVPITIDKAFKKLSEVIPDISARKICSFIVQGKLKPLIRYEGILDEHYFYTWHLQAALSGNYSHDDIDDFSPSTLAVTSRVFKGFLEPQNKDLFAKLLTQKKPEECIKFKISITQELDLYLGDIDDEYIYAHMDVLNIIESHPSIIFSHVQLKGNTIYGYADNEKGVELEATDFVFLEKQVINLLDEFRLLKDTKENKIIEHPRQDEVSPIIEKLVEEFPEDSTNSIWLKLVELAKNKQYGLEGYNEVMQEIIYLGGTQAEARCKSLGQEALRARIRRLKKKRTFKGV